MQWHRQSRVAFAAGDTRITPSVGLHSTTLTVAVILLVLVSMTSARAGEATASQEDEVGKHAAAKKKELIQQVDGWIAQLDDDDWSKRDEATKALTQLYPKAFVYFEKAVAKVADPEARMRLKQIIAMPRKGFTTYCFDQSKPADPDAEKLQELAAFAAPSARFTYVADLNVLAIVCDNQKSFRRARTLMDLLSQSSASSRGLKVFVVNEEQAVKEPAEK